MAVTSFVLQWVILLPSTLGEQVVWLSHVEALLTVVWWLFWLTFDVLVLLTVVDLVKRSLARRVRRPRTTPWSGGVDLPTS